MAERLIIPDARHEQRDVSGRFILFAFLLLLGSLSTVGLAVWGVFPKSTDDKRIPTTAASFPAPALQTNPRRDLHEFEAEQMHQLTTYWWVDASKGLVHIPIDRAMEKLAKSGIPGWPTGATTASAQQRQNP